MKLINFLENVGLNALRDEMGAQLKQKKLEQGWENLDDAKLSELLRTGEVEIEIDDINLKDGAFDYKGQKVIVYIRDQFIQYHEGRGYKYHLTRCKTINDAVLKKRKSRYVISLRTDGYFRINLIDRDSQSIVRELVEEMRVCKNCLNDFDYKGYTRHPPRIKLDIYDKFTLEEYFDSFKLGRLQKKHFRTSRSAPVNLYNENFSSVSKALRSEVNYDCEECSINLSKPGHQRFLHVHHIDGDKSNDNRTNLKALCIECHSNMPAHGSIRNTRDFKEFKSLRNRGLL